MPQKIGVLVGREQSWPAAFIEEVNRRNAGVVAEFVKLGGTHMAERCEYDLIIDRISHEVPYYRAFLKTAAMSGTIVINNPFWWSADDKFTGASIATYLGVAHPRSIALPTHSYIEGIVPEESLRNLLYPIPWEEHVEYVGGFPVILKPVWGGGFKSVYKVHSFAQLWSVYDQTGTECMMIQQFIEWDKFVRCLCIGQDQIVPIKFDVNAPWPHRYFDEPDYLTPAEHALVVDSARKLCQALGYDMNTVEFAIKDGIPYAIDFTNPAPDFDIHSLKQKFFDWVVGAMADLSLAKVREGRSQIEQIHWSRLINPQGSNGSTAATATSGESAKKRGGRKKTEATVGEKPKSKH